MLRAARHRVANALQVASGWAQLEETERALAGLERIVREEALLSTLTRSASEEQQWAFWQILADAEEAGLRIAFGGAAEHVRPQTLAEVLPVLREAVGGGRRGAFAVVCAADGVHLDWHEEDSDVRR